MRIVSLQPSVSIILDRLGCLDSLVACTKYCVDAVPALRERALPVVHDSWSTKAEELIPVPADLVIASVPYRQESLTAILKSGHPLLALAPKNLAGICQDIRLIASLVHQTERGEALISGMQSEIAAVCSRTARLPRCSVYCEEWGKPLIHSQPWVAELVEAAGGIFVGGPGATTSEAAIAAADPDATTTHGAESAPVALLDDAFEGHADELLNTPAPTLIGGLHALARAIHPEVFGAVASPDGRQIEEFLAVASKLKYGCPT